MRKVFITEDGQVWNDEKEAMDHELTYSQGLFMYDKNGRVVIDPNDAITVNIRTQAGLELFRQACDWYNLEEPDEVEQPDIYCYDDEIYSWTPMGKFAKSMRALFNDEDDLKKQTKEDK